MGPVIQSSLSAAFRLSAAAHADRVALQDGVTQLTFDELDALSDRVAEGLRKRGVTGGDRIGLCVRRGSPVVLGMLGILKAGACYVPLDPHYPLPRLRFMCEDSGTSCVLCDEASAVALGLPLVKLSALLAGPVSRKTGDKTSAPGDLAYIIYTSGSTGRPKGVMVTHANVLALIEHTLPLFAFSAEDRWTLFASYSFDFSVWEMWMPLITGATAVAVSSEVAQSPDAFVTLLTERKVTILNQVPSVFRRVVEAYVRAKAPSLALRYVVFAGEPIDRSSIRRFLEVSSSSPIWVNMYGITETTVHASFKELNECDLAGRGPMPIGQPLPHLRFLLLDEERQPVPRGALGELWVLGDGVAAGYRDRPLLMEERFVTLEQDGCLARGYRSGDLVRELADGGYEYVGRADDQVKVRGIRVELGEIEHVLREHPTVEEAAVVKIDSARSELLIALVVPREETPRHVSRELRGFLASRLPAAMVPNRVVAVDSLPLGETGKLDRQGARHLAERQRG